MIQLQDDLRQFLSGLGSTPTGESSTGLSLGRQLLSAYPEDPGFWLHYADACRERDDFNEAVKANQEAGRLLDEARSDPSPPAALLAVLDVLQWRQIKMQGDLLKILARGNPARQDELVNVLQRLAGLPYEDISQNLEEAMALTPAPVLGAPWNRHLEHMRLQTNRHGRFDTDHQADLLVIQDLATALMGAGRFLEAEQLFTSEPFTTFVPEDEDGEQELHWYPTLLQWLRPFHQHPLDQVSPFTTSGDRYVIGMVVWGNAFLDSLERFPLPSLLAQGNLPYLQGAGEVHLLFFTTETGAERLAHMPVMQQIRAYATVDIVSFPGALTATKDTYKLMSALHFAAMEVAKTSQSHFIFLAPDIILADNYLVALDQRMRTGAEVIFVPGLMLQMETFGEEQAQRFPPVDDVLSIPPLDLLELGLRHVHPFAKQAYTYSPVKRRPSASMLMWPLEDDLGYLVHGFHHTPYLVSAKAMQRFDDSFFFTIDGEFLLKIVRTQEDLEACFLLTDPRETNYFELSKGSRFDTPLEFDLSRLSRWGALQGPVARWLFPQPVTLSRQEPEDGLRASAAAVVDMIAKGVDSYGLSELVKAGADTA